MILKIANLISMFVAGFLFASQDLSFFVIPWLYLGSFAACLVLALLFLCAVSLPVNIRKPQHEDSPFYRSVMYLYIELAMQLAGVKMEAHQGSGAVLQGSTPGGTSQPSLETCFL